MACFFFSRALCSHHLTTITDKKSGRKSRPSESTYDEEDEDEEDPILDDCAAAMVLMSLSCSPKSPLFTDKGEKTTG